MQNLHLLAIKYYDNNPTIIIKHINKEFIVPLKLCKPRLIVNEFKLFNLFTFWQHNCKC